MTNRYDGAGYGDQAIGFGERPAIVNVDFQLAFTDPQYPTGGSPFVHTALENTAILLRHARAKGVPVASCNVGWCGAGDMGHWKVSSLYDGTFFIVVVIPPARGQMQSIANVNGDFSKECNLLQVVIKVRGKWRIHRGDTVGNGCGHTGAKRRIDKRIVTRCRQSL